MSDERFPRSVTCAWCGNRYRSAAPGDLDCGLQGSHCASDVVLKDGQWIVRCGYGSDEHDMHRYRFVANAPSEPADPVCDECISQRVHAGDLEDMGLEADRRPGDFGLRPMGTWGLISMIRGLTENMTAMRRLVDAAIARRTCKQVPCRCDETLEAAVDDYRKHQRWTGEIDDGGPEYEPGCQTVADQLRESAKHMEDLAEFWLRDRPDRWSAPKE